MVLSSNIRTLIAPKWKRCYRKRVILVSQAENIVFPWGKQQLYAQAMRALHQHEPYYFGPAETQEILEWNRRFSVKSSADLLFLDYFEPAIDEQDGTWMSASAIFSLSATKTLSATTLKCL